MSQTVAVEQRTEFTVDWHTFELKPGMRIKIDGSQWSRALVEGDSFSMFRLETQSAVIKDLAVRIEITGRTPRLRPDFAVRCRVVFLGDGEPDTEAYGWLYL